MGHTTSAIISVVSVIITRNYELDLAQKNKIPKLQLLLRF